MVVYTGNGDRGETSLPNSQNISKADPIFDILGTVDELNAILAFLNPSKLPRINDVVSLLQRELFELGSVVACKSPKDEDYQKFENRVTKFERMMDEFEDLLPPLTNFLLPGGSYEACYLNLARTVCRRLERIMVKNDVDLRLVRYINRLSDLLFVLSRFANVTLDVDEIIWDGTI